ncbi:MAG: hypothetical protein ABJD97_19030, partial [Betaproteobacteria bacterium]
AERMRATGWAGGLFLGLTGYADFGLNGRNPRAFVQCSSAQLGRAALGAVATREEARDDAVSPRPNPLPILSLACDSRARSEPRRHAQEANKAGTRK